jgi:hypothetical protein
VQVLNTEEKGSDVNLATHLVYDGCQNAYDVAVVVSNDTDLIEPIRVVTQRLKKPVGILSPISAGSIRLPAPGLVAVASFVHRIKKSALKRCQFPDSLTPAISKPLKWCRQDVVYRALELALTGSHPAALKELFAVPDSELQTLFGGRLPAKVGTAHTALKSLATKAGGLEAQDRKTVVDALQVLTEAVTRC